MLFRKKNTDVASPRRSLYRKLLRIVIIVLLGFIGVLLLLTGYFYLNRDNIGRNVLIHTNNITHGELSFQDITFNPFRQFPDISLSLMDVEYYENAISSRNQNEEPVLKIGRLYAALDIKYLIQKKINVSKVYLHNGDISLVRYPDSTLNLLNAFKTYEEKAKGTKQAEGDFSETAMEEDSAGLVLDLEQISLYDVNIEFDDRVERDNEALYLNRLKASFNLSPEAIHSKLKADMELGIIQISDKILFRDKSLRLETAFSFLRDEKLLQINPSNLSIGEAKMDITGEVDFNVKNKFSLQVDASDHDFSILQLFLTRKGLKNLKKGDLYLRGSIEGIPGNEIPVADLSFGLEDVTLYVPDAKDYIRGLNLTGKFNSGWKGDLSGATLDLDTMLAQLPSGYLNASFHLENILSPKVDIIMDMEAGLSGLAQVFRIDFIDSLQGNIRTKCTLLGARHDPDSNHIVADDFTLGIRCDSVSASIPGVMSIQHIDGSIYTGKDTTWLENLEVRTGETDFLINGAIFNALYLPFNIEHEIMADLEIQSEIFDLPGFLSFVPQVRESFAYRIRDVLLDVYISTSTSRLLEFETNPQIDFDIMHLEATIEDFLPRLTNVSGEFILSEKYHRTFLDFRNFEIDILESSLLADLELHSPAKRRSYMKMDIQTENLNPGEILWWEEPDSIPDVLNGRLNGSFLLDIYFPHDQTSKLQNLNLRNADLHFINVKDTFEIGSLNLLASDLKWDTDKHDNLLATLNASIDLTVDKLVTDYFTVDDLEQRISIIDGVFQLNTEKARFFSKAGKGEYILAPFAEVPYYKIKYDVKQFEVNEMLTNFLSDTVISGTMDFYMDISMEGETSDDILSSLNGELILYGEDLILYGIDLDGIIKKFKRSQNFNLVDLGAVMFAGPVGLALTKGGAYASILVDNYGESSPVREIVSDWEFKNGNVLLRDVAFSTNDSRVAAKGWLDFPKDSLDISFAVIDKKGCNIIGQNLYGTIKDPEKSNIKVIATLLAPVTNLLELALGIDCDPFYEGRIKHPE